jgi:hypothetical protein
MKIKVLVGVILTICNVSYVNESHAVWPFGKNKQQTSASGQSQAATAQKGKISRFFRSVSSSFIPACISSNAGRLDGFRNCLRSFLSSTGMNMDMLSSVLALDVKGQPIVKTIQRATFKQEWFRRQLTLAQSSQKILTALSAALEEEAVLTKELETAGVDTSSPQSIADLFKSAKEREKITELGLRKKLAMIGRRADKFHAELADVWVQYGQLQSEMGQVPTYTDGASPPPMSIPVPDATDAVFVKNSPVTSVLMSSDFEAALTQFGEKNPAVMTNFCHNFFAIGPTAGWEEDYARMGDKGKLNQRDIDGYQGSKNSIIAIRCSDASIDGLIWRKLYSLCPIGESAQTLASCSGFSSNEVTDTLFQGQSQNGY